MKVRIVNHSGLPAVIEYQCFRLVGSHGHVYRALPPIPPDHKSDAVGAIHPVYAASKFFVAPRYQDVYPTFTAWSRSLERGDDTSDERYRLWGPDLPNRTIERMGLPEGVVADGGEISGFLYFENAVEHEKRLTFRADIADEQSGDRLADIVIPFRVE